MTRSVFNFSPGPAMVPEAVLEQVQAELLDYHGTGMSPMELSHRASEFEAIAERAEADLRQLLGIPDTYEVLYMQGGATTQFAAVPLNLLRGKDRADYIHTGYWGQKAITEGRRFCDVNVAASSEADGFTTIPARDTWRLDADAAYVHYTPNETIHGVEFPEVPDVGDVPLVADMSSCILSRPVDVTRFGAIYAGAQKNMGPAGLTVVIVRKDLLGAARDGTPRMLDYEQMAAGRSLINTPPTFAWYVAGLVYRWLLDLGGLEAIARVNARKAQALYDYVDGSDFYRNPVDPAVRSRMNVPFLLADEKLNGAFLEGAVAAGLRYLEGHRSVGGMRASIYNAMPQEGVDALIAYMEAFAHARV